MSPKLKAAIEREQAAHQAMREAADGLEALVGADDGDADELEEKRAAAQAEFDQAEAALKAARADIKTLEHLKAQRDLVPRDLPADDDARPLNVQVLREERTYRVDGRHSYFRDLAVLKAGEGEFGSSTVVEARERVFANQAQWAELRGNQPGRLQAAGINQSATSGGEFVPPVWYVEQYAPLLRAGRPFADALGTAPLPPDTNSLNFPKITTGSSTAVQTDGGAVSNTDLVTTSVTAQVQTIAGRSVASYQFVDLSPVADQVIMQDLMFSYNTTLDTQLITGNVANAKGLLNVASVNTVTYTDATPTGAEFYAPSAQAASQIAKNAFVGVDFGVTHPSIWYNILSGLDSNTRPLYIAVGPGFNTGGSGSFTDSGNGLVGNIGGMPICIDANMPTNLGGGTNESRLVFLNRQGFQVWERFAGFKVADQTSITTLQYQFVAYGYYAVTSRQAKMISIISGTGLIPVTGF